MTEKRRTEELGNIHGRLLQKQQGGNGGQGAALGDASGVGMVNKTPNVEGTPQQSPINGSPQQSLNVRSDLMRHTNFGDRAPQNYMGFQEARTTVPLSQRQGGAVNYQDFKNPGKDNDLSLANRINQQADAMAAERATRIANWNPIGFGIGQSWRADVEKRNSDMAFRNQLDDLTRGVSPGRAARIKAELIGERMKQEGLASDRQADLMKSRLQAAQSLGAAQINANQRQQSALMANEQKLIAAREKLMQDWRIAGNRDQIDRERLGFDRAKAQVDTEIHAADVQNRMDKTQQDVQKQEANLKDKRITQMIDLWKAVNADGSGLKDTPVGQSINAFMEKSLTGLGIGQQQQPEQQPQDDSNKPISKMEGATYYHQKGLELGLPLQNGRNPVFAGGMDGTITKAEVDRLIALRQREEQRRGSQPGSYANYGDK